MSRAGTEHHQLCVGDLDMMRTDVKGLFDAGLALSEQTWKQACTDFDWDDADLYVSHQISQVHTDALCATLDIDPARVPRTFPTFGNIGPGVDPVHAGAERARAAAAATRSCAWASGPG